MRRRIAPYSTRIALDYSKIYGPGDDLGPFFVCMSESDIELCVKLLGYAKRRINWAVNLEGSAAYYDGLTDEEWQALGDHLDDLEGRLMAVICQQEIVEQLQAIATCVCGITQLQQQIAGRLPDVEGRVSEGDVTYKREDETRGNPTPPETDPERCELAQAVYYHMYSAFTEYLLPHATETADVLVDLIIVTAAFGALAGFIGIPVAVLGALVAAIVAVGFQGEAAELTNWLIANKDELICALYVGLPDFDLAAANVRMYVSEAEGLAFSEKLLINAMAGNPWWVTWVCQDQQDTGRWDAYLVPGQCDDCEPAEYECHLFPPCNEGEWWSSTANPVCYDGRPRCYPGIGVIQHRGGSLVPESTTDNRYRLTITGDGGSAPISVTAKWITEGTPPLNFTFWTGTVDPGETKVVEGTFNTTQPGTIHYLQLNNSPYFVFVDGYCIAPPE